MAIEGPPYLIKKPYLLLEIDELFDDFHVRESYVEIAKCVIRENLQKNSQFLEHPKIHKKATGTRYFVNAGHVDYIFHCQSHKIPAMLIVDSELTKEFILELVREFELP